MTIITTQLARKYIEAAPLPKRKREVRGPQEPPVELKSTDAQALVVGSGLVAAAENVAAQTREDLVNCTLFAQLAASGSVSHPSDVAAWYNEYFKALTALGWAQSDVHFDDFTASGMKLEVHKSIIKVLAALLGPQAEAVALVTQTLDALQSMEENSPWITLFNRESTAAKSAHFQVATAQHAPSGLVQISLVAFDLRSRSSLTQILFFKFASNSTKLKFASGNATIFEAALAQQRQLVAERLADFKTDFIRNVKFPPRPGTVPGAVRGKRSRSR